MPAALAGELLLRVFPLVLTYCAHHQYSPRILVHMTVLYVGWFGFVLPVHRLHSSHQYKEISCARCIYGSGKVSMRSEYTKVVLVCAKLSFTIPSAYLFFVMCRTYTGIFLVFKSAESKVKTVQYSIGTVAMSYV